MNLKRILKAPYFSIKIIFYRKTTVEDLIDFIFNKSGNFIKPMQIKEELKSLLLFLENKKINNALEIGTARGGTLFSFSRISSNSAKLVSIDLPKGDFGDGYSILKIPLFKFFGKQKQKIYLIRNDSHKKTTFKKVKKNFSNKKVDFLFIDGDHSYKGVKEDFNMYKFLVKKGGFICFHDIVSGPKENVGGVPKFWQEIKTKYKSKEFISSKNQKGYGIGLIKI